MKADIKNSRPKMVCVPKLPLGHSNPPSTYKVNAQKDILLSPNFDSTMPV